ncbi:DUF4261 domain-containing protein [Rubritalea tangerina]|uniref:DUF4261 domain-containing protein n=2 Tax=Rubritalea tangerina TaxID=430798 RepID=A0ABW4ZE08_9BACT
MRTLGILLLLILPLLNAQTTPADIPTKGLVPLRKAPEVQFAFLCINQTTPATTEALKASLVKWFQLKSPKDIHEFKFNQDSLAFSWRIGRSRFVATLETIPIPKDDIRYASNNSLHWPDAEKSMIAHKANYTISCNSIHRIPWHATLDLTKALAAFTETHDTAGLYWGDASIVHSPTSLTKQAQYQHDSDAKVPTQLWVGLLFESDTKGGWNIFTDGMTPLGHRDIEIHSSQLQRTQLFSFLNQLKHDVITRKVSLANDLLIEDPKGNEWKVTKGKSVIGKNAPVWVLVPTN